MAVVLITGSSTSIGLETALQLASSGHRVYASCRNPTSRRSLRRRNFHQSHLIEDL